MRLIDADKFYDRVKTHTNPYGKPTLDYKSGVKVMDMIKQEPTVDIKTEVAREIFAEIEEEIKSALKNNYDVRAKRIEKHGTLDEFTAVIDGKILALRGIEDFIIELKNKYTKEQRKEDEKNGTQM